MKSAKFILLFTLFPLLPLLSCQDQELATEPENTIEPSFGKPPAPLDPTAQRITRLIEALYPEGGLLNSALKDWEAIRRQLDRAQVQAAQSQARELAGEVIHFSEKGTLHPPDPCLYDDLPPELEVAVLELSTWLYLFTGLEAGDLLADYPAELPEDVGAGVIAPETGGTVVTGNGWAAVVGGGDVTADSVWVTIQLLDQVTCEGADELTKALGCWDIDRYPAGEFEDEVRIEICAADTDPSMGQPDWDLLMLHHEDDLGNVEVWPWAEPTEIDCSGFDPLAAPTQSPEQGTIASLFGAVTSRVGKLLLPEPLRAWFQTLRYPPRGVGGMGEEFSTFWAAVPQFDVVTVTHDPDPAVANQATTLEDGLRMVRSGGTIFVDDGDYVVEDLVVDKPVVIGELPDASATIVNNTGLTSFSISGVSSGAVIIQDLEFQNHSPGGHYWEPGWPEEVTHTSSIQMAGEYDQVTIQNNVFDAVQSSAIHVAPTSISGASVEVLDNQITGGLTGITASGPVEEPGLASPALTVSENAIQNTGLFCLFVEDVLEVTLSENNLSNCGLWGGIWVFDGDLEVSDNEISDGTEDTGQVAYHNAIRFTGRRQNVPRTGLISGNTIDGCGWGSCIQVATGPTAVITGNTIYGHFEDGTVVGILAWGGNTNNPPSEYRPTVTVTDNVLQGLDEGMGRSFSAGAIEMRNATGTVVSGNEISFAQWAFSLHQNGEILNGSNNLADDIHGVLRATYNNLINMTLTDFTNYNVALRDTDGTLSGSMTCNWWGSIYGPLNNELQPGSSIVYSPWASGPVANDAGGTCGVVGYEVSGTVSYSTTALAGVNFGLIPGTDPTGTPAMTTSSDATGHFEFLGVPAGDYVLKAYGDVYEYPAGSGEYPFVTFAAWQTPVYADVILDRDLPKKMAFVSPVNGSTTEPTTPLLEWEANEEAEAGGQYRIVLRQVTPASQVEVGTSNTSSYQVDTELTPGMTYSWSVEAFDDVGHTVGRTETYQSFSVDAAIIVMDGILSPGEWSGADTYGPVTVDLGGGATTTAEIMITNNSTDLMVGVLFGQDMSTLYQHTLGVRLDDDNDGDWNVGTDGRGDDGWVIQHMDAGVRENGLFDEFFYAPLNQGQNDTGTDYNTNPPTAYGGTTDLVLGISDVGVPTFMEMAHPLNSGDSRDAILSVDDLIGVLIMTIVWPDPDNPDTWYETVILGDDYPMSFQSYQIK